MRDERKRLQDILDAIADIEKYAIQGRQVFEQNELIQVWMVHHLRIIGEASRALPKQLKQQHQEIPWKQIIDMRTLLVPQYFHTDENEIWSTVENDLPDFKAKIEAILQSLGGTP